ncbi:MAG: hypothetical protein HYX32_06600 [Actinobacteria bacterium]|nr:hypothetical protein [Actinomycetota bacterium]
MSPATTRDVPGRLAGVLEDLELEQPKIVTRTMLDELATSRDLAVGGEQLARDLRARGWLLPLRTAGAWEFAPAARAGAIGSGDPFIELRATLAKKTLPLAIAAESAAWTLRLSGRAPTTPVIGAPPDTRVPRALGAYRLVRWRPAAPLEKVDGLPVWSKPTLLAVMAANPTSYRDWPNVAEWITEAIDESTADAIARELVVEPYAAWARAAYLLKFAGNIGGAEALYQKAPPPKGGPHHLGKRDRPGKYDKQFDVHDHLLARPSSAKA